LASTVDLLKDLIVFLGVIGAVELYEAIGQEVFGGLDHLWPGFSIFAFAYIQRLEHFLHIYIYFYKPNFLYNT